MQNVNFEPEINASSKYQMYSIDNLGELTNHTVLEYDTDDDKKGYLSVLRFSKK